MEHSIWRCTHRSLREDGTVGECDETMEQAEMEAHLISAHRYTASVIKVEDVIRHFVLVRTADSRGPGRRGKTEDQTEPMFDRGDFR